MGSNALVHGLGSESALCRDLAAKIPPNKHSTRHFNGIQRKVTPINGCATSFARIFVLVISTSLEE